MAMWLGTHPVLSYSAALVLLAPVLLAVLRVLRELGGALAAVRSAEVIATCTCRWGGRSCGSRLEHCGEAFDGGALWRCGRGHAWHVTRGLFADRARRWQAADVVRVLSAEAITKRIVLVPANKENGPGGSAVQPSPQPKGAF